MERLSGLDASFLYLETPTLHMHVSMAAVFDPSTIEGGYSFEKVRELVTRRLVKVPVFTRRLVEVPFRLGHPYWVDDPSFDIDFHLRRRALPAPGGVAELAEFVGDVCSRQLDRSKPLWQMYIVEGLDNGNIALVTKMHHSTIDGVSGAELLSQLFDLSSDPTTGETEQPEITRSRIPSDAQIVVQALATRLTKPPRLARLAWKTAFALLDVRKVRSSESSTKAALPLTAPRTSMNAAITSHRLVAFSSISLDEVKRLKNVVGATVNDVVLAICTGALRNYLASRDELPDSPLVATVPVSVQGMEGIQGSNHVSAMFVSLPTHIEDPLERLRAISDSTKGAKEEHKALGADVLLNWVEYATPTVFAAAARTYSRLKLADRHRPIHNVIISNVPGPDFPLYFSGAELVAGFPLGPIMEGAGLNITVMSYRGVLNWGLMACRETVAGAGDIADSIPDALDELLVAAGLGKGTPVGIAPSHRASGRIQAATEEPPTKVSNPEKVKVTKSGVKKKAAAKKVTREVALIEETGDTLIVEAVVEETVEIGTRPDDEELDELVSISGDDAPSMTRQPSEEELIAELLQSPGLNLVRGVDSNSHEGGREQR
jgi:diacylglycerol O-acyltransferase / wax synthase